MPHRADDRYVREFAKLVKSSLNPELKVYLEYSNEVWNGMFAQNKYAQKMAKSRSLGPAERPWEGGGMYYAERSVEIFDIWKDVFGGSSSDRIVRVLAWQAGNTWWMENIVLTRQQAYLHADALAIAPYIGMNVPQGGQGKGTGLRADQVSGWSEAQVFEHLEKHALPGAIKAIHDSKKVADEFGLKLLAYEGGQHLVGVAGGENNQKLTALFHRVNADPRIRGLYQKYFSAWKREGGSLFCYFSSVSRWSKWGSWGGDAIRGRLASKIPQNASIERVLGVGGER